MVNINILVVHFTYVCGNIIPTHFGSRPEGQNVTSFYFLLVTMAPLTEHQ